MIGADHVESPRARAADGREMVFRVYFIPPLPIGRPVVRAHGLRNGLSRAEQQPATLLRRGLPRVRLDGRQHASRDLHPRAASVLAGTSITIAIPIPPPMHNPATPLPPPRFLSA